MISKAFLAAHQNRLPTPAFPRKESFSGCEDWSTPSWLCWVVVDEFLPSVYTTHTQIEVAAHCIRQVFGIHWGRYHHGNIQGASSKRLLFNYRSPAPTKILIIFLNARYIIHDMRRHTHVALKPNCLSTMKPCPGHHDLHGQIYQAQPDSYTPTLSWLHDFEWFLNWPGIQGQHVSVLTLDDSKLPHRPASAGPSNRSAALSAG